MKRVLYSDNGTLTDYSVNLDNYHAGNATFSYVKDEYAIYIGSDLPFNHLYFKLSSVNTESANITVQYWDDDQWRDVVDTLDETSLSGATLGQSGFVTWTPDEDYLWTRESTNSNGEEVTGLTDVVIYDLYWIKITFSASLTADVVIDWVGNKFSIDEDLYSEFPEFNSTSFKTAYESGKTDWEEQHITAGKILIQDLQKRNVIESEGQILERRVFTLASVQKVAQIIYSSMGDDFADQAKDAKNEYLSRIKLLNFRTDLNKNARIDIMEKKLKVRNFYR